jgi:endonuclease/exonuclease/phosphatase family metal-dependent hydrolase
MIDREEESYDELEAMIQFDELESPTETSSQAHEIIGDAMNETPSSTITRIYTQNLNGIGWNSDGGKWPYICEAVDAIQADIACFSEINVDTNNHKVRSVLESITRRQFPQNRLVLSSSRHSNASLYKPGGTAIMACNAISSQIKSHSRDRMGRWSSICVSSNKDRTIRIISAYQVCQTSKTGANTAASHQQAQLIAEAAATDQTTRSKPRDAFIFELQAFIHQAQHNGEMIILVGDFNENISTPNSGMDRLATSCGLTDLFSVRTGSSILPATYQRGKTRIDYVLVSPELVPHVRAAGYEPFGYRIPSDHRGMFIDLDTEMLFRQNRNCIPNAGLRDFKSTAPEVIRKYVTAKIHYLNDHRFFERLTQLVDTQEPNHELAEALDRDMQRAAAHGARMVTRKTPTPWSPKLAEVWGEIHFYKLARTAATTQINCQPALLKLQNLWKNLPRDVPTVLGEIRQGYEQAIKKMKEIRQNAQQLREDFLLQQAALYTELQAKGKAKVLQRLLRAESQSKVYKKIQYLRTQENDALGINSLKIPRHVPIHDTVAIKQLPDTAEHWESITVPSEIEKLLLHRNQLHFGQAEGTPFTGPPLIADLGYKADGCAANMILNGEINYSTVDEATALFVHHLQSKTVDKLSGAITIDEVLGKLKVWKEQTTTSPSGVHLGHYHCLWRDPRMAPNDPQRTEVIENQKKLLAATVKLLNYSLRHGYSFHRWSKIVNVMLQKDPGNPRIHRLRIIHIYEADYNLLLAVKWRQAMHHAEDAKLLNDGLYGSRPGRSAHDPALLETLQNEIYRMSMKPGVVFDLDATSCYDRILANVAALSSRRMGMAKNVVLVNSCTLEKARYYLKTQLGVSDQFYQHSSSFPIHGTGQGSGNSPIIWCFVCDVLFEAFSNKAHGATFTSYNRAITMSLYMVGFVDDCSQRVNVFNNHNQPTSTQLLEIMARDAQLWNDLLWASGGALEPSKCSYYMIQTEWNPDGHPFLKGGTTAIPINIKQNGTTTPTWQISNYQAHKTLGCYVNPAYAQAKTWSHFRDKNEGFSQLLQSNAFSPSEAWTFYSAFYLPSILYPSCITPLSKTQCTTLDSRFLRTLIPRCGYNRNMAREIRYAPTTMGGAGFRQLYTEQGALLLQQMYKWLNSPDSQIGQMMIMTVSWTQAFIGTSRLFLTDVHQRLPPIGPSLLLDTMAFLREIDGKFVMQNPPLSQGLRQNDRHIMDIALSQSQWKSKHLSQINACRRYLQAQTLADIVTTKGTRILLHMMTGGQPPSPHTLRISSFNQPSPGKKAWTTWKKFLHSFSDKHGVLREPLGLWTTRHDNTRHWPQYVHDPVYDRLYSHVHDQYYNEHIKLASNVFQVRPEGHCIQAVGFPTAVSMWQGNIFPMKNYASSQSEHMSHHPDAVIAPMPKWEQFLVQNSEELASESTIFAHIANGNVTSCSDGSVHHNNGSFGYVLSTKQGQRLVQGNGPAPGAYPNSFRSEAYGVLAAMQWLLQVSQGMQIPHHQIIHYLDNKSVIRRIERTRASKWHLPNRKLLPEQDVIDEIVRVVSLLPLDVEFTWIKGHQDSLTPYNLLPLAAQLNCDADREASRYPLIPDSPLQFQVPPLPQTPCQLLIANKSITSKLKQRVREAATLPPLFRYMEKKFKWQPNTTNEVDWANFTYTLKKYRSTWSTMVKHCYDISPTGDIAHRNNKHLPHACPSCGASYEDNNHVMLCPHPSRAKWRQDTCTIAHHYDSGQSDPYLLDILRDGLMRWHQQTHPPSLTSYPAIYHRLLESQNAIGWDQLYKGRWSTHWARLQDRHISKLHTDSETHSGQQWATRLSRILIDQWMKVWKLRNKDRHGVDRATQIAIRESIILSELEELYSYKHQVCPIDRHLFYVDIRDHMSHHPSLDALENWVENFKPAIHASVAQAQRLGICRNRLLYEYPTFNPTAQPTVQASRQAGSHSR